MEEQLVKAEENKTKLVAPTSSKTKMVKIRAIRDIAVGTDIHLAGSEVEVPEALAADLCTPIEGSYAFSGDRDTRDAHKHMIRRAERMN